MLVSIIQDKNKTEGSPSHTLWLCETASSFTQSYVCCTSSPAQNLTLSDLSDQSDQSVSVRIGPYQSVSSPFPPLHFPQIRIARADLPSASLSERHVCRPGIVLLAFAKCNGVKSVFCKKTAKAHTMYVTELATTARRGFSHCTQQNP